MLFVYNLKISAHLSRRISIQLGRGISLGAAYALASGQPLGFYSDGAIHQYAFGFKLSGDIIADLLSYDIYGSV